MKNYFLYSISILFIFLNCVSSYTLSLNDKRPWTILTYMAGANNLNEFINFNVNQMHQAANNNTHILAYITTQNQQRQNITKKLIIEKSGITQDGPDIPNLDSGSETTLMSAIEWALDKFPSDRIALGLWNHGSGPLNRVLGTTIKPDIFMTACTRSIDTDRGVCYDDTTGNYLTDLKLYRVLETIYKKRDNKPLDFIFFDACLMATVEIAYTIKPFAKYMVASQQTVPGDGYDYYHALAPLSKSNLTEKQLAATFVQAYHNYYNASAPDYTLAAINLAKIDSLVSNIKIIAQILSRNLQENQSSALYSVIAKESDADHCTRFEEPTYADLYNFYNNLYTTIKEMELTPADSSALKAALKSGMSLIRQCVTANAHGVSFAYAAGLSIYLPQNGIDKSYPALYWTQRNPAWLDFLQTYLKV